MRSHTVLFFALQSGWSGQGATQPQHEFRSGSMSIAIPYTWFEISMPRYVLWKRMPPIACGWYSLPAGPAFSADSTHFSAGMMRSFTCTAMPMKVIDFA